MLLHPTSLPGPFGIGDLGPIAYRWVETLAAMKQTWWQILPLGPTGAGDSPYQSFSAFAGEHHLLSPELLERDGLVASSFWAGKHFPDDRVDYGRGEPVQDGAAARGVGQLPRRQGARHLRDEFDAFRKREAAWLDDYALFMAIRDSLGGAGLPDWPTDLLRRDPAALAAAEKDLADAIGDAQVRPVPVRPPVGCAASSSPTSAA